MRKRITVAALAAALTVIPVTTTLAASPEEVDHAVDDASDGFDDWGLLGLLGLAGLAGLKGPKRDDRDDNVRTHNQHSTATR